MMDKAQIGGQLIEAYRDTYNGPQRLLVEDAVGAIEAILAKCKRANLAIDIIVGRALHATSEGERQ